MRPPRKKGKPVTHIWTWAVMLAACAGLLAKSPIQAPASSLDGDIRRAFTATYNLDYAAGLAIARETVARAPKESRAHRALATIVWLEILFQRGAVTIDTYLGGITKSQLSLQKPPADLDAEFKREVTEAIA